MLFFPLILLSSNSFFSYLFFPIFCSLSSYFSTFKRFLLVYLQLLIIHDCCIRVIHNMVTALLEHLNLLAVFPEAYFNLILFVTILVSISNFAMQNKLSYSSQTPIFPEFCSLLLASYFSKKKVLAKSVLP